MTRLKEKDIDKIERQIEDYDRLFCNQTGKTMEELACKVVGIQEKIVKRKAAVVSVTSGLGVIGGFAQSVAAILGHCGIETKVMEKTDVAGLQQAYAEGAEVVFLADDDVCAAFGIGSKVQSDNGEATGRGYGGALIEAMRKQSVEIAGQEVLIVGAGSVGAAAAQYIAKKQAVPIIYDLQEEKAREVAERIENAKVIRYLENLSSYPYIVEASTAADVIKKEDVSMQSIIAAPGMPCGVSEQVTEAATVIHNPLELGIIVMYFECLKWWDGERD